ncbi:hypothetical protein [Longimicrobium sp.]|uniref:hypothetical protein n=1 Tax=Longimicrobium sp. TaxID=2029185 RepID=UPI003B3A259E
MDPDNPVVKLCAQGMEAEFAGRPTEARDLFVRAWDARADDYDAAIAAHFVARHQATTSDTLRWNQEALARADAVGDERVRGFYPSLYLNLGHSHEQLGQRDQARHFYGLAAAAATDLPRDSYSDTVRDGIARGLQRVAEKRGTDVTGSIERQ